MINIPRCLRCLHLTLALALLSLLLTASALQAANPNWPNEPTADPREEPPDDPSWSNLWNMFSYIPDSAVPTVRPEEIDIGSGIHADRAWQVTTGNSQVVIAITDSGIYWNRRDTVEKIHINTGELPLPEGSEVYDANGDGRINALDYDGDSRVGDLNSNGYLDAHDLILAFSDDVDDDENGYIDDIAGWDFLWDDNDAYDQTHSGHGSFEADCSAGEGNNGYGGIGVCPDCMVMPLRVADDFVGSVSHFNEAMVYAADNGASVVQHANGTLTSGSATQAAIDYAWEHDLLYVAAMGDETSFHNNYPGALPRSVYVNASIYDTRWDQAGSYLRLSNCSGWGSKVTLTASHKSCSSGATGMTSGAAGLIFSRGLDIDLQPSLSANEVKQILIATAIDIDIPESLTDPDQYPSKPGWDQTFGYGRLHARNAVDMVAPTTIPPEAEILAPRWFAYVDPERTPDLEVEFFADARRRPNFDWVVEVAGGLEPTEDDFVPACVGNFQSAPVHEICTVPHELIDVDYTAPVTDIHDFTFTVRVLVTDDLGNVGRDRRVMYLRHDPDLLTAMPLHLGGSQESGPQTADLNGDGVYEIILGNSDGWVSALDINGEPLPGWPQWVDPLPTLDVANPFNHLGAPAYASGSVAPPRQVILGTVAVGDLESDGVLDVVATTLEGFVYAWDAFGQLKNGFPVSVDPANAVSPDPRSRLEIGIANAPALSDLDGDGKLEIIVGALDRHVYVWRNDGSPQPGFPVKCEDPDGSRAMKIVSSPAIGDIDGDGQPDIVIGTNERSEDLGRTYAIHGDGYLHNGGAYLKGWPVRQQSPELYLLPFVGEGTTTSPVLDDIDGDGISEAVITSGVTTPQAYGTYGRLVQAYLVIPFGLFTTSREWLGACGINFLAFADINVDGIPDLLASGTSLGYLSVWEALGVRAHYDALLFAINGRTGLQFAHFPRKMEDWMFLYGPSVAYLDDGEYPHIIMSSGGYIVHAIDVKGNEPEGWPKFTGHWNVASPTVGDLDGDGYLEVIVGNREGRLFVWRSQGRADQNIEWKGCRHDPHNTGNYETDIPTQPGPAVDDDTADDDTADDDTADDDTVDDDIADDDTADDDVADDDVADDDVADDDVADDDVADDDVSDDDIVDDDVSPDQTGDDDDDSGCGC